MRYSPAIVTLAAKEVAGRPGCLASVLFKCERNSRDLLSNSGRFNQGGKEENCRDNPGGTGWHIVIIRPMAKLGWKGALSRI